MLVPHAPNALVVEAEPVSRIAAAGTLGRLGWRVTAVDGLVAAVEALARDAFTLALIDLDDSAAAVAAVRAAGVPHILGMRCAWVSDAPPELAAQLAEVLAKPLRPSVLRAALEALTVTEPAIEPAVDLAVLDQMSLGDPEALAEIVDDYLAFATGVTGDLAAAHAASDLPPLARVAHRVAGNLGLIGGRRGAALARRVEACARAEDPVEIGPMIDELQRELGRIEVELRALRPPPSLRRTAG